MTAEMHSPGFANTAAVIDRRYRRACGSAGFSPYQIRLKRVSRPGPPRFLRASEIRLRRMRDLATGIWVFELCEVPRHRAAAEALWRAGGCAARDDTRILHPVSAG